MPLATSLALGLVLGMIKTIAVPFAEYFPGIELEP
jgi:hypothetical protein